MPKRKLGRKIALYCIIFAFVLTAVLGTVGYTAFENSLLERYEVFTRSLLDTATTAIDAKAIANCIATGAEDEHFTRAQEMLCAIKENASISYIYMVYFPEPTARQHRALNFVMNGFTAEEALDPDYISHVGDQGVLGEPGDPEADFDYDMTRLFYDCLYGSRNDVFFYVNNTEIYGYQMTGYKPIRTSDGKGLCVLALDVSMDEIKNNLNEYMLIVACAAVLLLALYLIILLSTLSHSVIKPVKSLAMSAKDFVEQSHTVGDHPEQLSFKQVSISTKDEIELLGSSLNDMTSEIKAYMINLKTVVGEKERISAELDLATSIQVSMLPSIFPAFPDRPEVDIYATMDPAKEVGGDFYDFFFVDHDHLCIVIADVSGKGVPAALFMVIAKTLIKNNALAGLNMGQVFTRTNEQLCENNGAGLFVTAWAGMLELSTGRLVYVNAGHNPPLLKRADGQFEYLKSRRGFVLAGMEGMRYRETEMSIQKGDCLFLYTDGVTEAANKNDELFGEDRLLTTINIASFAKTSAALLERVAVDLRAFVDGAPQSDDITMLGFRMLGGDTPSEG